jgi:two-component system response regulator AlgR
MSAALRTLALRILVIDDEPPARDRLKRLIEELEGCECVGEGGSGQDALTLADKLNPDVVLLDIRMPGMDGVEAARHFADFETPPAVIFTTAYDQYALDAFETHAVGYLLKPVRREKLEKALEGATRPTRAQLTKLAKVSPSGTRRSHIAVRARDELKLVPVDEIRAFIADQKYTTIRHPGGAHLIEESLRSLEDEFNPDFVRIHRAALVALRHIEAVERVADGGYAVRLRGNAESLPVSRRLGGELLRRIRSRD